MRAALAAALACSSAAQARAQTGPITWAPRPQAPETWTPCERSPVCCDSNPDSTHQYCPGAIQCGTCGYDATGRKLRCACPGEYTPEAPEGPPYYWSPEAPGAATAASDTPPRAAAATSAAAAGAAYATPANVPAAGAAAGNAPIGAPAAVPPGAAGLPATGPAAMAPPAGAAGAATAAAVVPAPPAPAAVMANAPKVEVLFLTEAGCPPCQRAVAGEMSALVAAPGVADIIDLQNHPFGNNYFVTQACGGEPYNTEIRHCWARTCVEATGTPPADCFTGDLVTQHGPAEGMVDRMEACAKAHSSGWQAYFPFLRCMEREYPIQQLAAAQKCAAEAGLNYDALEACYMGPEGDTLVVVEAKATIDHEVTPTIKVNGKEVTPDQVLAEVCAAYLGPKPAGCPGLAAPSPMQV